MIDHETLLWKFFCETYHDCVMHPSENKDTIFITARTMRVLEVLIGAELLRRNLENWAAEGFIKILGSHNVLRADEPCVRILNYVISVPEFDDEEP